jgi:hypothetical protein
MHVGGVGAGWSVKGEEQPRVWLVHGVDFRGSAAEEKLGPIGWATPGAASLDRKGPRPHKLGGLQRTHPDHRQSSKRDRIGFRTGD